MKTFFRWLGVVFLPVPALILFVWLAWMLSNVLPSLGLWGSTGNQFGLTVAAGALVIYLTREMAPCGGRYVSACWAIIIAGVNIVAMIFGWNEYSRADVVQTIALILGPCLGAYWTD